MLNESMMAGTYQAPDRNQERIGRLMKWLEVSPADDVLDLGCGHGLLALTLNGRVRSYVGVDRSARSIGLARQLVAPRLGNAARFEECDLTQFLEKVSGPYDKIFLFDVDFQLADEHFKPVLSRIQGALKAGGKVFIYTVNGEYFLERLQTKKLSFRQALWPYVRTGRRYKDLLSESGFNSVHIVHLGHHLPVLSWLNPLMNLPGGKSLFGARLLIIGEPAATKKMTWPCKTGPG